MNERVINLFLLIFLILTFVLGSIQGRRIEFIRDCEKFYRWLQAVGTQVRLFEKSESKDDSTNKYVDLQLFAKTAEIAMQMLMNNEEVAREIAPSKSPSENLSDLIGNMAYDYIIWEVVTSPSIKDVRNEFFKCLREGKIQYGREIGYAEAQASGVNIFNLFFGFRKIAAGLIWLEVDRYWHQGLLYRMVPLMRTCVALDPNFVEAYLIGAWHLAYNATAKLPDTPQHLKKWSQKYNACLGEKETFYYLGIDFLKRGIRHNPREYRLYFDLGFAIYKNKLNDYQNAVKYLTEAVKVPHERWVRRQLYICLELNGEYEKALEGWQDYMKRFPDNPVAPRFILRNQGKIYEEKAKTLLAEASKENSTEEREKKISLAKEYKQKAREIWGKLRDEENDPYGDYRLLFMEAMDLYEEGRYLEAVAVLDKARWESPSNFDEASDMIIKIKQEGGIPLTVSERKAVLRKAEGEKCQGMPEEPLAINKT
ncbi:MAG: hypothetical protein N3G21_09395 [Candidatus Hydrogenedentes bacterium]|nr:hypothetical protein [Candidatus Hydrogenedentota bacterium]